MSQQDDLYAALKNADAAGDTEGARKLAAYIQSQGAAPAPAPAPSRMDAVLDAPVIAAGGLTPRRAFNMGVGALRGAKDVIDTGAHGLASLYDKVTGSNQADQIRAEDKAGTDAYAARFGDNTDASIGRVGGQAAITLPVGGVLGQGARLMGAGPKVVNALTSNGFSLGAPAAATTAGRLGDLAIRSGASGLDALVQAGVVDPSHATTAGAIGLALPGAMKVAGVAGSALNDAGQGTAKWLMKSALKGTIKMHSKGDVETAAQTLLDYGINPTNAGVEKIKGLVGELNDKISAAIQNSDAKIDKQKVLNALASSRERFGNQPAPTKDLATIQGVADDFTASHPDEIPIQLAQKLKQGGNRLMRDKYGQLGTAEEAATKDLTRGLKEGIAEAAPEVAPLNAAESRLLTTLKVTERRAMMDVNKNPVGLDAAFALASGHPGAALGLIANSRAYAKAMAARGLNTVSQGGAGTALNALAGPAAYRALPRAGQQQP